MPCRYSPAKGIPSCPFSPVFLPSSIRPRLGARGGWSLLCSTAWISINVVQARTNQPIWMSRSPLQQLPGLGHIIRRSPLLSHTGICSRACSSSTPCRPCWAHGFCSELTVLQLSTSNSSMFPVMHNMALRLLEARLSDKHPHTS
jgi:hypothetical protein